MYISSRQYTIVRFGFTIDPAAMELPDELPDGCANKTVSSVESLALVAYT